MYSGNNGQGSFYPAVAFDSEEGKSRRAALVRQFRNMFYVQGPLAFLATVSGAVTVGLAIPNPEFPYLSCFPLVNGILMLIGALFAYRIGKADIQTSVPPSVRRDFILVYVIYVVGFTFCSMAAGFAIWGIAYCVSGSPLVAEKCQPNRDAKLALCAVDTVLGLLLFLICFPGTVLFCKYAGSVGFKNHQQAMVDRMAGLENQIAAMRLEQQQQAGSGGPAPPPYAPPYTQWSSAAPPSSGQRY